MSNKLVAEIKKGVDAYYASQRNSVTIALDTGEKLIALKKSLPEGTKWLSYLKETFTHAARTLEDFMLLARHRPLVEQWLEREERLFAINNEAVAHLHAEERVAEGAKVISEESPAQPPRKRGRKDAGPTAAKAVKFIRATAKKEGTARKSPPKDVLAKELAEAKHFHQWLDDLVSEVKAGVWDALTRRRLMTALTELSNHLDRTSNAVNPSHGIKAKSRAA